MSREDLVAGIGLVVAEIELCTGSAQDLLLNRTEERKLERKPPCLLGAGLERRTQQRCHLLMGESGRGGIFL